jgi:hypothetical protein
MRASRSAVIGGLVLITALAFAAERCAPSAPK